VLVTEHDADLQTDPIVIDVFELREGFHGDLYGSLEMGQSID
jgi:hypothetical protein